MSCDRVAADQRQPPVTKNDVQRAFGACWQLISELQYCLFSFAGLIPRERVPIRVTVDAFGESSSEIATELVAQDPAKIREDAAVVMRCMVPASCEAVLSSFEKVRFDLAGERGVVALGTYCGASAHEIVWQIANEFLHHRSAIIGTFVGKPDLHRLDACLRARDEGFAVQLSKHIDLDELVGHLQAEYALARREQDRSRRLGIGRRRPEPWPDRVLALIFGRGRDWTVEQLASTVGVRRQTLYKNPRIKEALKARRAPGGAIAEGDMEGERRFCLE